MLTPRRLCLLMAGALGMFTACSGSGDLPLAPAAALPPLEAPVVAPGPQGLSEAALPAGILSIDPAALSATIVPPPVRQATGNGTLALLALNEFLAPEHLQVAGINRVGDLLHIRLRLQHPFGAPQVSQPASAKNRADLSFAGRLLVLAEVPVAERAVSRFFGDSIRLRPGLLVNADGYTEPRGLVPTTGFANVFPYVLVVDEAKDNRLGRSNGNNPQGNYLPSVGGWQRLNLGGQGTGWTGYGVLHAGQTAAITLEFDLTRLGPGPVDLPLVILAKHAGPAGGAVPVQNRLPSVTVNTDLFAYRMPFGALDCEQVRIQDPVTLPAQRVGATGTLAVQVRDWDARAPVSLLDDLGREPDVQRVPLGTSGSPQVLFDVPLLDPFGPGTLSEITPQSYSGHPGQELRFAGQLEAVTPRDPGTVWGVVQVRDPEALDPRRTSLPYERAFAPDLTLLTNPMERPVPITWQVVPVTITPPSALPQCKDCHLSSGQWWAPSPPALNLMGFADDSPEIALRVRLTGPVQASTSALRLPPGEIALEAALDPWGDPRFGSPLPVLTQTGLYQVWLEADDGDRAMQFGPWPLHMLAPGVCPEFPFAGTPITKAPEWSYRYDWRDLIPEWSSATGLEPPVLAVTGSRHRPGWFYTQGPDNRFWRFHPESGLAEPITAPGFPGEGWEHRALLIEVDHRGRLFWVASNIDQTIEPDPSLDSIYEHAGSTVYLLDADATLATEWLGAIETDRPLVAMCIDERDALWLVDNINRLRKFIPDTGGSATYEPGPGIELGSSTAGGILGPAIYDIDLDFHNHAFYLPVRTPDDHLSLWRIECNGGLVQPGGSANPLADLGQGPVRDAAIVIDNYGPQGQVLTGQQDAQFLLVIEDGTGALAIATSDLIRTAQRAAFRGASRIALDYRANTAWSIPDQSGPYGAHQIERWTLPPLWR